MGRPKGHPGPVKPEGEKMNNPIRFGVTKKELELIDRRVAALGLDRSKYFRMLAIGDIKKNA